MADTDSRSGRAILQEADRHPLLDRDEERRLLRRAEAGDGEAVRRLVGSHLRFVVKIARPYRRFGLPMSDLLQEGTLGLVQALRRFDSSRGVRLSTYAMWWIRAAIQDYVQRSWSMVRGSHGAWRNRGPDTGGPGGDPSEGTGTGFRTLAGRVGQRTSEIAARARRLIRVEPSYDPATGETVSPLDLLASDAPSPEQRLAAIREQRQARAALAAALDALPPREAFVIRARYLEEVRPTFAAIGRELGVSKDRARQLEAKALDRLRHLLAPAAADLG